MNLFPKTWPGRAADHTFPSNADMSIKISDVRAKIEVVKQGLSLDTYDQDLVEYIELLETWVAECEVSHCTVYSLSITFLSLVKWC